MEQAIVKTDGPKSWTFRDYNLIFDKPMIREIVREDKMVSRIFVTGEVHQDYVGEKVSRQLLSLNGLNTDFDVPIEPLFVETRNNTVRMVRFDPKMVWREVKPEIFEDLFYAEAERLGLDMGPEHIEYPDFYENMVYYLHLKYGPFTVPVIKEKTVDEFNKAAYLTCLLLYGKPGYLDVPAARHFADPDAARYMQTTKYRQLEKAEQVKLRTMLDTYGSIRGLTNLEMSFALEVLNV
ncbi:MAG: hypothetical protein FWD78_15720 [Treponema sp.]|nr:hypothetical protein [Treponema sp.]